MSPVHAVQQAVTKVTEEIAKEQGPKQGGVSAGDAEKFAKALDKGADPAAQGQAPASQPQEPAQVHTHRRAPGVEQVQQAPGGPNSAEGIDPGLGQSQSPSQHAVEGAPQAAETGQNHGDKILKSMGKVFHQIEGGFKEMESSMQGSVSSDPQQMMQAMVRMETTAVETQTVSQGGKKGIDDVNQLLRNQ